MKRKNYILITFVGIVAIFYSCQDTLNSSSPDICEIGSVLTVEEAKTFFETQVSASATRSVSNVKQRVLPGDFSPCWDQTVSSNSKNISNIDVPILPQYKYRVIRCKMTNSTARAYTVNVTQKLVISKKIETNKIGQYYMTLIPDHSYYKKNKGDISSRFISRGDKGNYSGLIIYSLPQTNIPIKIEKYVLGEKIFSMLIPATTSEETHLRKCIFNRLVKNMKFAVSQSVQTRFGESGDFWDWFEEEVWPDAEDGDHYTIEREGDNWYLDDGEGGKIEIPDDLIEEDLNNDWFEPGNWSPHDDFDDFDNSNFNDGNYDSGPWLQIYHRACGQLLTVVNWNDWDGGALYCSRCRKSVTDFKYTYSFY